VSALMFGALNLLLRSEGAVPSAVDSRYPTRDQVVVADGPLADVFQLSVTAFTN